MQEGRDNSTVTAGDFSSSLSADETKEKTHKDTEDLTVQPETTLTGRLAWTLAECKRFSGTFTYIDSILDLKTNLNVFKRIHVIQSMFSDHKEVKSEKKNRKTSGNFKVFVNFITYF